MVRIERGLATVIDRATQSIRLSNCSSEQSECVQVLIERGPRMRGGLE